MAVIVVIIYLFIYYLFFHLLLFSRNSMISININNQLDATITAY